MTVAASLDWRERAARLFPGGVNSPVRAYRAVGDESRSLEACNRGLASSPEDPLLLLYKAQSLQRLGRAKAAEICMDKAIKAATDTPGMLRTFAEELQLARDEKSLRRVQDLLDPLEADRRVGERGDFRFGCHGGAEFLRRATALVAPLAPPRRVEPQGEGVDAKTLTHLLSPNQLAASAAK